MILLRNRSVKKSDQAAAKILAGRSAKVLNLTAVCAILNFVTMRCCEDATTSWIGSVNEAHAQKREFLDEMTGSFP
jgi:hypothetical protein